jgi:hypothetical protein
LNEVERLGDEANASEFRSLDKIPTLTLAYSPA